MGSWVEITMFQDERPRFMYVPTGRLPVLVELDGIEWDWYHDG